MTQLDVRELAGIHEDSLRKIENGLVIPKYETLQLLSNIYKVDVIELLIEYKSDKDLISYVDRVNEIVISNKIEELQMLTEEFNIFCDLNNNKLNLFNRDEIHKFKLYLKGINEYFKSHESGYTEAKNYLYEALSDSKRSFNINDISSYKLNYFEISLLLLLGIVMSQLKELDTSNKIMRFCLSKIEAFNAKFPTKNKMMLKLMYNISYNCHIEDKHLDVLDMTSKAIDFATSNHILYLLPHLFYRKGIAEFKLGIKDHKSSLKTSIVLLDVYNMTELKNHFIKTTHNLYNINILD
jgi:transcriptional regulator with XRE-family HTH domain